LVNEQDTSDLDRSVGLQCYTVLEPSSDVLKDTFVSKLPALLGLAVHPQWSRSLQICACFGLQPHAFSRCFAFLTFL